MKSMKKERDYLAGISKTSEKNWEEEETFNNFNLVWGEKIKELEGHISSMKRALKNKKVNDAFKEAELIRVTVNQGLEKSKESYEKYIRL